MRKRITYANVAATLALVFSMSGGALAASHYLITSTKQISPKVLKKLKGATGPEGLPGALGPVGPTGATGATGATGKEGKEGKEGKQGIEGKEGAYPVTLAAGKSESGVFALAAGSSISGFMTEGIAFSTPLAGPLEGTNVDFLKVGETDANCPGVGSAAAGYLCVYAQQESNATVSGHAISKSEGQPGASASGFLVFLTVSGASAYSYGAWTVTAA
jgi:hypothetical protein